LGAEHLALSECFSKGINSLDTAGFGLEPECRRNRYPHRGGRYSKVRTPRCLW